WTWFESIEKEINDMFGDRPSLHASEVETSMLLNFTPQYIKSGNYKTSAEGASNEWGKFYDRTIISEEVRDFSQSDATGNPVKTNLKKGEKMLALSKEKLGNLVEYISSL